VVHNLILNISANLAVIQTKFGSPLEHPILQLATKFGSNPLKTG